MMNENRSIRGRFVVALVSVSLIAALVTFVLSSSSMLMASGDDLDLPETHPARLTDRLSVVMRGVPASPAEKKDFESGAINLPALAEKYRSDEKFAERLAQYWAQTLKITGPFDFAMVEDSLGGSLLANLRPNVNVTTSRSLIFRKPDTCTTSDEPRFELYYRIQEFPEDVQRVQQRCQSLPAGSQDRQTCDADLVRTTNRAKVTENFRAIHDCSCAEAVNIRPWWNLASTVKVCPSAIRTCPLGSNGACTNTNPANAVVDVCGPNLAKCMPRDSRLETGNITPQLAPQQHDGNRFFDEVIAGLTLEPAMLIAKNIQENHDYRQVLTTKTTVLTGAVEAFLKSEKGAMISNQTAGRYDNGNALIGNQSERKSWRRVDRGAGNAGVLTTPMFHQVTNGYRAKANRAYESFLCRRFIIPPGVVDGDPDETDLTKRQPCASCHIELEPLGNMFKRWPEEGTNFLYSARNAAQGGFRIQPQGQFEAGVDAEGFANLFVKDERFAECAVQRAFEFAIGREPSEYDIEYFFPKWKQKFITEGYKVWPMMLDIIQSVYFRGGWK